MAYPLHHPLVSYLEYASSLASASPTGNVDAFGPGLPLTASNI